MYKISERKFILYERLKLLYQLHLFLGLLQVGQWMHVQLTAAGMTGDFAQDPSVKAGGYLNSTSLQRG